VGGNAGETARISTGLHPEQVWQVGEGSEIAFGVNRSLAQRRGRVEASCREAEDLKGRCADEHVGGGLVIRHARTLRAAFHAEGELARRVGDPDRERARGRGLRSGEQVQTEAHPVRLHVVSGSTGGEEAGAPAGELREGGLELASERRQLVERGRRGRRQLAPRDDLALLETLQPFCEHAGADSGKAPPQIAEPLGAEAELAQDEQRPALAEDLGRARQRTELRVA
jgi:hypothetical protein